MRAMAVTGYGRPLEPIEVPEPTLREGTALLEVVACGVCFSDVKVARGLMPFRDEVPLPHVPGHEVVGRVIACDPPGAFPDDGGLFALFHSWPCGRCPACRRGDEALCAHIEAWVGFTHPGGFQERLVVPLDRLVPLPPGIDAAHGAPTTCALGTALRAVVTRGQVGPGDRVMVIGLGGVGIHAAQIAAAAGARVIGLDPHAPTVKMLRTLGIESFAGEDEAAAAAVEMTGGEGVDVAIDTVGRGSTLATSTALVRRGGRVVGVGYSPTDDLTVATTRMVLDELAFIGSRYASRDEMQRAIRLVASGRVTPVVSLVRPLDDINEVFDALAAGDVVGRAVVDVSGTLQHTPFGQKSLAAGG
ncbi:MAG: alcohol dehydrogenase catalytic domain-containing protein [Actinomycetota bacterium]